MPAAWSERPAKGEKTAPLAARLEPAIHRLHIQTLASGDILANQFYM